MHGMGLGKGGRGEEVGEGEREVVLSLKTLDSHSEVRLIGN